MEVTKIPKKRVTVIEPKRSIVVDKAKYEQLRVAAYCRVSTDSEEQLTSYKTQMKVYVDWGFDGSTLLHSGKYIKYPKNSNCQRWMKRLTSKKARRYPELTRKGNQ